MSESFHLDYFSNFSSTKDCSVTLCNKAVSFVPSLLMISLDEKHVFYLVVLLLALGCIWVDWDCSLLVASCHTSAGHKQL